MSICRDLLRHGAVEHSRIAASTMSSIQAVPSHSIQVTLVLAIAEDWSHLVHGGSFGAVAESPNPGVWHG